jgi:hypothetical protein
MNDPPQDSPHDATQESTRPGSRRVNPLLMMTFWLGVFFLVVAAAMMTG